MQTILIILSLLDSEMWCRRLPQICSCTLQMLICSTPFHRFSLAPFLLLPAADVTYISEIPQQHLLNILSQHWTGGYEQKQPLTSGMHDSDILDIHWLKHVSNASVREQMGLNEHLRNRRTSLYGHVVQMDAEVQANKALQLMVKLADRVQPEDSWNSPPGRPHSTMFVTHDVDVTSTRISAWTRQHCRLLKLPRVIEQHNNRMRLCEADDCEWLKACMYADCGHFEHTLRVHVNENSTLTMNKPFWIWLITAVKCIQLLNIQISEGYFSRGY